MQETLIQKPMNFMLKQPIYFKNQSGMALIYTMLAVLLMSMLATALLNSQKQSIQAYNAILNEYAAQDSIDFCVQAAIDTLQKQKNNNTLVKNTATVQTIQPYTQIDTAYAVNQTKLQKGRISQRTQINQYISCTLQFIKEEAAVGSSGAIYEIQKSREYGTLGGSNATMSYYLLKSIKTDNNHRIEYHTVLTI